MKAGCCQNGSMPAPHSMEGKERHGKKGREKKGLCVYFFSLCEREIGLRCQCLPIREG